MHVLPRTHARTRVKSNKSREHKQIEATDGGFAAAAAAAVAVAAAHRRRSLQLPSSQDHRQTECRETNFYEGYMPT